MNLYLIIAALLNLFITIGHFTMGKKLYLEPMLGSSIEVIPKKIMHSLFHYSSVFMVLTQLFLTYTILGSVSNSESYLLLLFIALQYIFNGLVQIVIAITSGLEKAILKLFQWTLFIITGSVIILAL